MWPRRLRARKRRYLYEQNIINHNGFCYVLTRIRLKDFLYELNYIQLQLCTHHFKLKYFYIPSVTKKIFIWTKYNKSYSSCYVWTMIRLKDFLYELNYIQLQLCTNHFKWKYFYFSSVTKALARAQAQIFIQTKYNKL